MELLPKGMIIWSRLPWIKWSVKWSWGIEKLSFYKMKRPKFELNVIYTILFTSYFGKTKISSNQGLSIFYNVNYDLFQYLKIMLRFT